MTKLLASITNVQEARVALNADVDIVDLKNPLEGALGALPLAEVHTIVGVIAGRKLTSATIGDLPMDPELLICATEQMAQAGVDIIKLGFFGSDGHRDCIKALKPLADKGVRMVGVLFADQSPDFGLLPELKAAGFYGVMLDTAEKAGNNLLDYILLDGLSHFVQLAHACQLECGLAGSLGLLHIPALAALKPDYLGFRGALCKNNLRASVLSGSRVNEIRTVLYKYNKAPVDAVMK